MHCPCRPSDTHCRAQSRRTVRSVYCSPASLDPQNCYVGSASRVGRAAKREDREGCVVQVGLGGHAQLCATWVTGMSDIHNGSNC